MSKKLFELFCRRQKELIFKSGEMFFKVHSEGYVPKKGAAWLEKMPF